MIVARFVYSKCSRWIRITFMCYVGSGYSCVQCSSQWSNSNVENYWIFGGWVWYGLYGTLRGSFGKSWKPYLNGKKRGFSLTKLGFIWQSTAFQRLKYVIPISKIAHHSVHLPSCQDWIQFEILVLCPFLIASWNPVLLYIFIYAKNKISIALTTLQLTSILRFNL